MRVVKRNGDYEDVSFDKVLKRIKVLSNDVNVNVFEIAQKVCSRIYDGVKTTELDELAAHMCSSLLVENPDYGVLASRIIISNHHKNTSPSFSETIQLLYSNVDQDGEPSPLISEELYDIVMKNKEKLNTYIDYSRDYNFDYFGFKTLERSYLMKINNRIVERPQQMWMRVALGIHGKDFKDALQTYDLMSRKYFTHATPTLFNAGTPRPQCSSCFVAGTKVYTLEGVKNIEDVQIGDMVITHMNRPRPVSQIHVNDLGDRKLFDFKAFNTPTITATDNHSFMSITCEQEGWGHAPQWNTLEHLRVGDYIEIPQYTGEVGYEVIDLADIVKDITTDGNKITYEYKIDPDTITVRSTWRKHSHLSNGKDEITFRNKALTFNRRWIVDEDFCKFLGIWYGDGHVMKQKNSSRQQVPRGIGITIDKRNLDLIDFCVKYGERLLGFKAVFHEAKNQNVTQVIFGNIIIGRIFQKMFGEYFNNKFLYKNAHKWSRDLIEHFLCGIICADGFVTKDGLVRIAMCNPSFVRNVYNLARSRGIIVSYVETDRLYKYKDRGEQKYKTAWMTIPKESAYLCKVSKTYTDGRMAKYASPSKNQSSNVKVIEGRIFVRIMKKEPTSYTVDKVYNIGVEEDHSYMVDGIIAKNCYLLSMNEDSLSGIFSSVEECAMISKYAGGIGIHVHQIRAKGSRIKGTNGTSDGLVPMLRVFNNVARYVNQCFTPETMVHSMEGPKRMDNITTNDFLLTHDGTFKKVNGISKKSVSKEILEFRTKFAFEPVRLTPEHEVLVIPNQRRTLNFNVIKNRLVKGIVEPTFQLAKDVTLDDFVGFPLPNFERDIEEWDTDFCRFYGIMIGDGHIHKRPNCNSIEYGVSLNLGSKFDTVEFIRKFLTNKGVHYWEHEDKRYHDSHRIGWSKNIGLNRDDLYIGTEKAIKPEFLHLPKHKLMSIFKGLMETDGHNGKELYFHTTSYGVAMSVRYILLRLGILSSGNIMREEGKGHLITRRDGSQDYIETKKACYVVRIPKDPQFKEIFRETYVCSHKKNYFTYDNILWSRILSIGKEHYTGDVYDFNMIDNHNYTVASLGLVHNSGRRNGSIAVYLEPWHADIEKFIELRKNHGHEEDRCRDLFLSLWVPDLFMERVKNNDKWCLMCPNQCPGLSDVYGEEFEQLYTKYEKAGKFMKQMNAQDLWFKILENQIETGVPYVCFKDHANRKSNQKNLGTIKSSNLCVAGDTRILTSKGYYPIKELKDQNVEVWNGKEWSQTTVHQTGVDQKLMHVQFTNGMSLKCTPYHKFYIETGTSPSSKSVPQIVEAKDLQPKMRIIRYKVGMVPDNGVEMKYAYTHGLFCADGTYSSHQGDKSRCMFRKSVGSEFCKRHLNNKKEFDDNTERCSALSYDDRPMLWLYGEKARLADECNYINRWTHPSNREILALPYDMPPKYSVPINCGLSAKLRWLEGLSDGDGCVVNVDGLKNIQIASTHQDFLKDVVYMLQTLGINASMSSPQEACSRMMPEGRGGSKMYECKKLYRINIDTNSLIHLKTLGFNPKRLDIGEIRPPHHITNRFVRIASVQDDGEIGDTYCFNEPKEHKGIFNGVLTSQCSEIIEYSSPDEIAVCNLSSICLPTYIEKKPDGTSFYNFEKLHEISKIVTKNLNKVIDRNYYPLEKARKSNLRHRPVGIGIQGLADTFVLLKLPFESDEAKALNKQIFETIYHGAMESSMEIAKKRHELIMEARAKNEDPTKATYNDYLQLNEYEQDVIYTDHPGAYCTFEGSPTSQGLFQFDLWNAKPSDRYDWDALKEQVKTFGIRNSLLLAPMPTASTAQIMGFNESFEPFTSNIFKRKTLSGEFVLVNSYLIKDLRSLNLWNKEMKDLLILQEGSVQNIKTIPQNIRELYKTVWEIKQKHLVEMAADRGQYICQSQSLNIFMEDPDFKKLTSLHFYNWQLGLKTSSYYLRTRPRASAIQFTIDPKLKANQQQQQEAQPNDEANENTPLPSNFVCTPNEDGVCLMCGS